METYSEGEVRLQRAMLSQALQVSLLLISKMICQPQSILWLFQLTCVDGVCCSANDIYLYVELFFSTQESLDELMVKKRWYGDRDDFTVILQESPFITDLSSISVSPSTPNVTVSLLFLRRTKSHRDMSMMRHKSTTKRCRTNTKSHTSTTKRQKTTIERHKSTTKRHKITTKTKSSQRDT